MKNIIWVIDSGMVIWNNIGHESIVILLKLKFDKMLIWFNVYHNNINKLINDLNINVDYIKEVFCNVFINTNC
jgi:hypothetical protein